MRDRIVKYQEENKCSYNLEATPGEGTSYRLAKKDIENILNIITAAVCIKIISRKYKPLKYVASIVIVFSNLFFKNRYEKMLNFL